MPENLGVFKLELTSGDTSPSLEAEENLARSHDTCEQFGTGAALRVPGPVAPRRGHARIGDASPVDAASDRPGSTPAGASRVRTSFAHAWPCCAQHGWPKVPWAGQPWRPPRTTSRCYGTGSGSGVCGARKIGSPVDACGRACGYARRWHGGDLRHPESSAIACCGGLYKRPSVSYGMKRLPDRGHPARLLSGGVEMRSAASRCTERAGAELGRLVAWCNESFPPPSRTPRRQTRLRHSAQ